MNSSAIFAFRGHALERAFPRRLPRKPCGAALLTNSAPCFDDRCSIVMRMTGESEQLRQAVRFAAALLAALAARYFVGGSGSLSRPAQRRARADRVDDGAGQCVGERDSPGSRRACSGDRFLAA